jgi:AcrR family transcriptional regulator
VSVDSKITEKKGRVISRNMIKKKAVELFVKKGVDNTSVNDIVKTAGIAKGTFYLYYKNRDDLINDVFEKYGTAFFNEVILKNKDAPKITFLADSILKYFSENQMFLIELKKNLAFHREFKYYEKTMSVFSKVILNFINLNENYPIKQLDAYSEIIIGTILDICYRLFVDKSIKDESEAKVMMEDFMKRFFDCEQIFI